MCLTIISYVLFKFLIFISEELSACFTDRDAVFNLDCLRITLDMICLVLPTELELPTQSNKPRPSLQRLASHVSQVSSEMLPCYNVLTISL